MIFVFLGACVIVVLVSSVVFNRRMRVLSEQARKDFLDPREPDIIERLGALEDPTSPLARRVQAYDFKMRLVETMMSFGVTMTEAAKTISNLRK